MLDIVPAGDSLVVKARVDRDIDEVHPGLGAVRQSHWSSEICRTQTAVIAVSADRLVDDRTGESYYLTRVELADGFAEALGGVSLYLECRRK